MKEIDWTSLGFDIVATNAVVSYTWANGSWDNGTLLDTREMSMDCLASGIHYGQSCFEGLKAFKMKDDKIRIFRPQLNAQRIERSCKAACMPFPSPELFLQAVYRAVEENKEFVPPYGSNGSLYIRPFVFGSGPQLGLSPAPEFKFMVVVNPVGDYYKGGMGNPVKSLIKYAFDRAAPNGTGSVKLAGNYAPVLGPSLDAKQQGYSVMLFLDSKTNSCVEEFGTSNFAALTKSKDGKRTYVTPRSSSILPSVTNRSLLELAHSHFKWNVERRVITWQEVLDGSFEEIVACGTAVVLTPVGQIDRQVPRPIPEYTPSNEIESIWDNAPTPTVFDNETYEVDGTFEGFRELLRVYRDIQNGDGKDDMGWMMPAAGISF